MPPLFALSQTVPALRYSSAAPVQRRQPLRDKAMEFSVPVEVSC